MRVSIVIDNYNSEAFVAQAIESALAQTHADLEVLVVDDGSTDRSAEVIRRYRDRVRVIEKPNGGQGSAYNCGFADSSGELVIFLDGDDWLYPQAAQAVAEAWWPGVSKVQFELDMVDRHGRSMKRQLPRHMQGTPMARQLMRRFGTYGSPPGSGNAFHRSFLERVLPMDEEPWRIGADTLTILPAPAHGEVVSIQRPLGAYRIHHRDESRLFFNNAPPHLRSEAVRLDQAKHFMTEALDGLGIEHDRPLLLAPWEVRVMATCTRFDSLGPDPAHGGLGMRRWMLRSIWAWPLTGLAQKLALTVWVLAVLGLPARAALPVARLHRAMPGRPTH